MVAVAAVVAVGAINTVGAAAAGVFVAAVDAIGEAPGHPAPTQVVREAAVGCVVAVGGALVQIGRHLAFEFVGVVKHVVR